MKQVSIFQFLRDPTNHSRTIGKKVLRVINVHESFVGIGEKGAINKAEFKKLADALEPYNDGITIS